MKVSFTLAAPYTPQFSPWFLGVDRGYFQSHGVTLNISPGTGSAQAIQAIGQGTYDCGTLDTGTASPYIDQGLKAKAIALLQPVNNFGIIYFADSGIKKPKDLEGKTIAVSSTAAATVLFPAFAKATGLDASKVIQQNVALSAEVPLVIAGKAQALAGNGYSQGVQLQQKGGKPYAELQYADYGVPLTSNGILCNTQFLAAHPDAARGLVAATIQTFAEAAKDPQAAAEAGDHHNPELKGNIKDEVQQVETWLKLVKPAVAGKPLGWSDDQLWSKSLSIMHEYMGVKDTNPAHYYTNEYLPAS